MSNQWAAFDLDEVLANIRTPMQSALHELTGKNIHWKNWTSYNLGEVYGFDFATALESFKQYQVLEKATLEEGAESAIRACRDAGLNVAIITARGWHENGEQITRQWLGDHNIQVDQLTLVPVHGSKNDALKALGEVELYIDDHHDHIRRADKHKCARNLLLRDRPWNRGTSDFRRITHLDEILDWLPNPTK